MIERSLRFGDQQALVGTVCLPDRSAQEAGTVPTGIVLFNAGIVHRVGPHRINVKLARELAKLGIPSIRFDLGGLGDSTHTGGDAGFEAQAVADIRAAMTTLTKAAGTDCFGLFGFCSGAYHSYHTAQIDERVAALLLFDAYRYATFRSRLNRLWLRLRQPGLVTRLARHAIKPFCAMARRVPAATRRVASAGFIVDTATKQDFAHGVERLLDRGVEVALVFAGDDFAVYNYARQFQDAFRRTAIANRVTVTFLPEIDHVATGAIAQAELVSAVLQWAARLALATGHRHARSGTPGQAA